MVLHIIDIGWGISRKDGSLGEKEVARASFALSSVGELPPMGPANHVFKVKELGEDYAVIECSAKREPARIGKGQTYIYRPLSLDGGHYYSLRLE